MHGALVDAVLPQGDVKVTGETRLSQLKSAPELLQAVEQRKA